MSSVYAMLLSYICIIVMLSAREAACSQRAEESAKRARSPPILIVTSILTYPVPFLMRNVSDDGEEFVGFIPDLMERVAGRLGINYEIRLVSDGKYGAKTQDGTWNGMVGELTRREADIAAAPLTVTSIRERVIEFTMPFMVDYIAVFIKKSHATQFGIRALTDLASQSTVKYGALAYGSTRDFFRSSKYAVYSSMWEAMASDGSAGQVQTLEEGVERVLASTDEQPWAFLSESAALKYAAAQRCDVEVIEDEFVPRYLSLAVPIGSTYSDRLTLAILELLENGEISTLRTKWWNPRSACE